MALKEYTKNIKSGDHEGKSATVQYDFGDNLQEAVNKFTEEVVFSNFRQQAVVSLQNVIATALKAKDFIDPQEHVDKWKLGMAKPRKSEAEKVASSIENVESLEELKKIQEQIKARAKALA